MVQSYSLDVTEGRSLINDAVRDAREIGSNE